MCNNAVSKFVVSFVTFYEILNQNFAWSNTRWTYPFEDQKGKSIFSLLHHKWTTVFSQPSRRRPLVFLVKIVFMLRRIQCIGGTILTEEYRSTW